MGAPGIKVGLNIVPVPPSQLVAVAQAAEDLGFESLWSGEHLALPMEGYWQGYPGAKGPEDVPFKPDSVFLDPLVTLAHLAAVTTRVRLGVGIYMLALRNAVLAAKMIATVDVLSNGRLDLAVGLGWTEHEYRYTGNDWKTRGKRMNESIDAIDVLLTREHPEFHGEFFDFPPLGFQPKGVQQPRPKIHIGGGSTSAMRRAATRGDGWYGGGGSPQTARSLVEQLGAMRSEAGRGDLPFEYSSISLRSRPTPEFLDELAAAGYHRIVVTPWSGRRMREAQHDPIGPIESYAREIGLS
jgi:probable F420-dependent oxidoreductase